MQRSLYGFNSSRMGFSVPDDISATLGSIITFVLREGREGEKKLERDGDAEREREKGEREKRGRERVS